MSYSGRWDIVNAAKRLAQDALDGKVKADEIDEELFSTYLALKDLPDPDLLIRTGGDYRISNFLYGKQLIQNYISSTVFGPISGEIYYIKLSLNIRKGKEDME